MRRITLMLASIALMVGVVAPVAWAEDPIRIKCHHSTQLKPCLGSTGDDIMSGTNCDEDPDPDCLGLHAEEDFIYGLGGNDIIRGLSDNDTLSGGSGNDLVRGGDGNDDCRGGAGDDDLRCGGNRDAVSGDNGNDTVLGGRGKDLIDVSGDQQFGFQDQVLCGPGEDLVLADANDDVDGATCEVIRRN